MNKEDYLALKEVADQKGERVNEFIKKAIKLRLTLEANGGVDKTTDGSTIL